MKILIAPDKFKGSLTSFEVCDAIAEGINLVYPNIQTLRFPMADGGDGFATVMQHYLNTSTIECNTVDPLGRPLKANYQFDQSTNTAIIETASASGLTLLKESERNPLKTSTLGTGIMIKHAINLGAKKIILGLGGSATNDAGTGILSALGFQFFDEIQNELTPIGQHLSKINHINQPASIAGIHFQLACDVTNPLYGEKGAAYIYAPQKGANEQAVKELDNGLKHFSSVLTQISGQNNDQLAGTGAAGGIAAGLLGFFSVQIEKGTDLLIEASNIKKEIPDADLIITGEGKMDQQTKEGKVAGSIAALARKNNTHCLAICGINELDLKSFKQMGFDHIYSISDHTTSRDEAISNAAHFIKNISAEIIRKQII